MNGRALILLITFLMFTVGFGLVIGEYFYELGLDLMKLAISAGVGIIGLVTMMFTLREYMRNWYWHEVHKEHVIAGVVILIIIVIVAWHYGVIDWLLSNL
ncbi:MAG: hypothetical protein K5790_10220 [Nitrosopumilus sp.]|uniref:hypothetical protein n=1 Tax=Nitrosopumilus sp. TaxID=2024843 RepID=UPI00247C72A7|nr:hypothetical protein [Nitrosopumilus sp.]MCV0393644.1 hypothetical protein [Nitrosopumilus sp.]